VEALVEEGVRSALAEAESSATLDTELPGPGMMVREPARPAGSAPSDESQMALFLASGPAEIEGAPLGAAESVGPRLWQVHDTYLLAETREGLLIIDQHSAHERVLFQRLMEAFERQGQESQRLLFPVTLRLTPAEVREVLDLRGILSRAGFEVEEFGGDTVILQAVPTPHRYFDAERCFREMVQELTEGSELVRSAKNQHERIAMTFACKGAIKAGQALTQAEMEELFDSLFATDLPYHDVHGRPTIVRLSKAELERKFGRH
jgi:DNA mismatch repair protein MutL